MKIINSSTKKVLTKNSKICSSIWSQTKGLILSSKKTLLFTFKSKRIISLHMIGVLFPIDVILLDSHKKVIEIKKNLKPFHFFTSKTKAQYVIEIPKRNTSNHLPKIGDKIIWNQ